jgi:hypothetical protein
MYAERLAHIAVLDLISVIIFAEQINLFRIGQV